MSLTELTIDLAVLIRQVKTKESLIELLSTVHQCIGNLNAAQVQLNSILERWRTMKKNCEKRYSRTNFWFFPVQPTNYMAASLCYEMTLRQWQAMKKGYGIDRRVIPLNRLEVEETYYWDGHWFHTDPDSNADFAYIAIHTTYGDDGEDGDNSDTIYVDFQVCLPGNVQVDAWEKARLVQDKGQATCEGRSDDL